LLVPALAITGNAQESFWARASARAVLAFTRVDPVPGGGGLGEIRVVQPVVMLHAGAWKRLRLVTTLNFEGATISEGELTPGAWGEGFMDRRHPHTYVHELLLSADDLLGELDGPVSTSLAAGKGFAPFGTDDPMIRPVLRYPVNHHLAQILERAVVVLAARSRWGTVEAGLFNGDEPERPGQWPRVGGRFGDSWSARVTAWPVAGIELQGSLAEVHSPEHRPGAGLDQDKWSVSALWNRRLGRFPVYGLVELARTAEAGGFFVFHSLLAEGAWSAGRHRLHYRFERSERPEEERISAFRSLRPHLENTILGTTRWTVHTAGYEVGLWQSGPLRLHPLAEVSYGRIGKVGAGLFDVRGLYGGETFWSFTIGLRISAGPAGHRMGRYGAAAEPAAMGEPSHAH
jgi:hypothetical protein